MSTIPKSDWRKLVEYARAAKVIYSSDSSLITRTFEIAIQEELGRLGISKITGMIGTPIVNLKNDDFRMGIRIGLNYWDIGVDMADLRENIMTLDITDEQVAEMQAACK